jgi:hypothetical protein
MTTNHHYEPPTAYHDYNSPCKSCGKTARHKVHQMVPVCGICEQPLPDCDCTLADGEGCEICGRTVHCECI